MKFESTITFKEFLKMETSTTTANVAQFQRPIFAEPLRRNWIDSHWLREDPFFKKKKKSN